MIDNLAGLVHSQCDPAGAIEITREILGIPSPQTDLFEREPQVLDFIRNAVRPYLEGLGIPVLLDDRGNLVSTLGAGPQGIALIGYAMTPQVGSMKDGHKGLIVPGEPYGYEGPCLRGRGCCEQKGALGAMLAALKIIAPQRDKLKGTLTFICSTAGETGRHDSLDYILKAGRIKADLAVIGLGTNNEICLGNKGRVDVLIDVHGKACHSSVPDQGLNAIEGAGDVVQILKGLKSSAIHSYLERSTFAPMHIESFPRATHTIQDKCTLAYDRRLLPGENPEAAIEEIRGALNVIHGYHIDVRQGPFMYPSEIERDSRAALLMSGAVRAMTGKEPVFTYFNSALDAGLLNRAGIQCLMLGPGNVKFAHTDEEVVPGQQVVEAAKIYAYAVLDMLG